MIWSTRSEYAIRALVHLARFPKGQYLKANEVAEELGIPANVLAKVFQKLAQVGILRSMKGTTGGFTLSREPAAIRLFDVVDTIDVLPKQPRCITGLAKCSDDMPCSMHDKWTVLRLQISKYLSRTNIAALSARVNKHRAEPGRRASHSVQKGPTAPSLLLARSGRTLRK